MIDSAISFFNCRTIFFHDYLRKSFRRFSSSNHSSLSFPNFSTSSTLLPHENGRKLVPPKLGGRGASRVLAEVNSRMISVESDLTLSTIPITLAITPISHPDKHRAVTLSSPIKGKTRHREIHRCPSESQRP